MPIKIAQVYLEELPMLIAEERLARFEDVLMTNENLDNNVRRDYVNDLQKIVTQNEPKSKTKPKVMSKQMREFKLQLMGIGIKDV